jgi:hypothetical protein
MNTDQADRNCNATTMALRVLLVPLHYAATEASIAYHCDAESNPDASASEQDEREQLLEMAELREQTVRHIIARYVAAGAEPTVTLAEYKSANDAEAAAFADVAAMVKSCLRRAKLVDAARAFAAHLCDDTLSLNETWKSASPEQRKRAKRYQLEEFRECDRTKKNIERIVLDMFCADEFSTRDDLLAAVEVYADAGIAEVERLFEGR